MAQDREIWSLWPGNTGFRGAPLASRYERLVQSVFDRTFRSVMIRCRKACWRIDRLDRGGQDVGAV